MAADRIKQFLIIFVIKFGFEIIASDGANILGIFTTYSPSHLIIHMELAKTLAETGHNVTVVTSMKSPQGIPAGVTHVLLLNERDRRKFVDGVRLSTDNKNSPLAFANFFETIRMASRSQYELLLEDQFRALYAQEFDLVIVGYFMNVFQFGIAAKFRAPLIVSWVGAPLDQTDDLTGNPSELSYVPNIKMPFASSATRGFKWRAKNFILHMYMKYAAWNLDWDMEYYYNALFGHEVDFPHYASVKRNASLVFSNYHTISEGPIRPLLPVMVEVGGLQIREKPTALPIDIAEFLNKSDDGVIFLSLGTNYKMSFIKPVVLQAMYKVLSSLNVKVLWKWDDSASKPGSSPGILFKQWLPQNDVLAHRNVKLFITHAGKGGIAEAQYHGVPMVALPSFSDQPANAETMRKSGFGRSLDILTLTESEFRAAIADVLENPIYRDNVKRFSELYRDRPLSARQSVIYWTNYVLRHKGAKHLQSPVLHMSFLERYNLDLYSLFVLILLAVFSLLFLALRLLMRVIIMNIRGDKRKVKRS